MERDELSFEEIGQIAEQLLRMTRRAHLIRGYCADVVHRKLTASKAPGIKAALRSLGRAFGVTCETIYRDLAVYRTYAGEGDAGSPADACLQLPRYILEECALAPEPRGTAELFSGGGFSREDVRAFVQNIRRQAA